MTKRLRRYPKTLMLVATAIAAAGVVIVASDTTWTKLGHAFAHPHPWWLLVVAGGAVLAAPAYAVAYHALLKLGDGPALPAGLILQIVAVGFGPFVPAGGFSVDKRALTAFGSADTATVEVSAIGLLEMTVMCPPVFAVSLWFVLDGANRAVASLAWWWIIGTPIGFAIAFAAMAFVAVRHTSPQLSGIRGTLVGWIWGGLALMRGLRRPGLTLQGVLGMAAYWAFDIASFVGAIHLLGATMDVRLAIVAYASGYMLTRRSMPFGGAGVTEVFLAFSLYWAGLPLATALAIVIVYRVFNFVLPAVPALMARQNVRPLIEAREFGQSYVDTAPSSAEEALVAESEAVGQTHRVHGHVDQPHHSAHHAHHVHQG